VLGIELATRRRNRLSARVVEAAGDTLRLAIDQSFGNCPQYIQTRQLSYARPEDAAFHPPAPIWMTTLDDDAKRTIQGADTFFVASAAAATGGDAIHGADVSHRGGQPGFVRVGHDNTLTVPDFSGNLFFNTLGNFVVYPRAGLLFVDFESGDLLSITGTVEVIWDGPEVEAFQGAERLWRVQVERAVRLRDAIPHRFSFGEFSPNTHLTGTWEDADARLEAALRHDAWRPFRVVRVKDASSTIRSFYLEPADDHGVSAFAPGQFLTLRLTHDDGSTLVRTYTVSSAPHDTLLRISVKREGRASTFLHDRIRAGALLEAKAPRGHFRYDASEKRPAVLLSAGVGVTPMISMLRHTLYEGARTRHYRPLTFIHGARSAAERAFYAEALQLAARAQGQMRVVSFLSEVTPDLVEGEDYQGRGRIDVHALRAILPLDDYDFFVCGPGPFMQDMYDALRSLGVRDARIFSESFGPAALTRQPDMGSAPPALDIAEEAMIEFRESGAALRWTPADGSLLDFSEAHGLTPVFGCRKGACGSCAVPLLDGDVTYTTLPTTDVPEGQVLICCARPAKGEGFSKLSLGL